MKRTAFCLLVFGFLLGWLPAQEISKLSLDYAWLTNLYHYQVTQVQTSWPLAGGDTIYFGYGNLISANDSIGRELPLICRRHNDSLQWIHYLEMGIGHVTNVLTAKAPDDRLMIVAESDTNRIYVFEIDTLGTLTSTIAFDQTEIAGWGEEGASLGKAFKQYAVELFPGWIVFRYKEDATILTREGKLVWNGGFENLFISHDLLHYAPNGTLHLIGNTDSGATFLNWYQFHPDASVQHGYYAPSREKWSTRFLTCRKKYEGLYDRTDKVNMHRFHPVNGGKDGYLVMLNTKHEARFQKNSYQGHTLIRTDQDGKLLWTRRYPWDAGASLRFEDTANGWIITNKEEQTHTIGKDGFYLRNGESIRIPLKIKDKKLAKYDALDQNDLVLETVETNLPTGSYQIQPEIIVVDTPAYTYPPEEKYSGTSSGRRFSRTRPKLFRKGPLWKAAGDLIKGTGKAIKKTGEFIRNLSTGKWRRKRRRRFRR